jgi:hypothetical protein
MRLRSNFTDLSPKPSLGNPISLTLAGSPAEQTHKHAALDFVPTCSWELSYSRLIFGPSPGITYFSIFFRLSSWVPHDTFRIELFSSWVQSRTNREQNPNTLKPCYMTHLEARRISYLQILLRTTGWRFESSPVHHSPVKT